MAVIKTIQESSLTALGDAIRAKGGTNELLEFPTGMIDAINNIQTGGGGGTGGGEMEPIVLEGSVMYGCASPIAWEVIEKYPELVSTKDLSNTEYMFYKYPLDKIPFELNYRKNIASVSSSTQYMFAYAKIRELPIINNIKPDNLNSIFYDCKYLREVPENYFDNWDFSMIDNATSKYAGNMSYMFNSCASIRKLPMKLFEHGNPNISSSYCIYYSICNSCYALDEIVGLPFPHYQSTFTSDVLRNSFNNVQRLKNFTFKLQDDGTPYIVQWKSQTIDVSSWVGYGLRDDITGYNSGITKDKEVSDDTSYHALKNDPDWYAVDEAYSRYNHDSAVATINSLPDTSAYLASAGGTNTVKFYGVAGSKTDGGAINTLTEEEIAVAAAKGWTVTFV